MDLGTATVVAVAIVAIPAVLGAYFAYKSSKDARESASKASRIEQQGRIRQARLDERDLIKEVKGFLIPVAADTLWADYERALQSLESPDRKAASEAVRERYKTLPPNYLFGKSQDETES